MWLGRVFGILQSVGRGQVKGLVMTPAESCGRRMGGVGKGPSSSSSSLLGVDVEALLKSAAPRGALAAQRVVGMANVGPGR